MKTNKLQQTLKLVDDRLNTIQPSTMDEFLDVFHSTDGMGNYGSHVHIVHYKGYLQGVRAYVTGRSKSHVLPTKGKVYSVFNGLDKYYKAGWPIDNDQD